jgi:23S rRNA (adenine2503-C2)-methyltransferase
MVTRPDIRSLSFPEIDTFFKENGQKSFRARQVYDWLWKKSCRSFEEMSNLSKEIRSLLEQNFTFRIIETDNTQKSSDGTIKSVFRLHDGLLIEGVLIPADGRTTACISSQAGCPLGCTFCATGHMGFKRNLDFTEIYDQVVLIREQSYRYFSRPLSNIVFMGMGEPLLNYDQVKGSLEKISDPEGMGISPQRITVSTVGIPEAIMKMAAEKFRFPLALSLHAATDEKRSRIIPVNKKYPVKDLVKVLKQYHKSTGKRITIEYILFKDFNDTLTDAADLAVFCKNFPVKINLIEYNPVANSGFMTSDPGATKAFQEFLEKKNLVVNIRKSRGKDIAAACGQLAGKKP